MKEPLNIVLATDDNYAPITGVLLYSLMSNSRRREDLKVYVLTDFISQKNLDKLDKLFGDFGVKYEIVYLKKDRYDTLKISGNKSPAIYYVVDIPNILVNLKKVIYLDCDIIVERPIGELFELDMKNKCLAAMSNLPTNFLKRKRKLLGMPQDMKYFNSGVILMDLDKMRKKRIPEKAFDFILKNPSKVEHWDQDGLNHAIYGDFVPIEPFWNFTITHSRYFQNEENSKNKKIIHFNSHRKPWLLSTWLIYKLRLCNTNKEYYQTYWEYLNKSPWKNLQFKITRSDYWLIKNLIQRKLSQFGS